MEFIKGLVVTLISKVGYGSPRAGSNNLSRTTTPIYPSPSAVDNSDSSIDLHLRMALAQLHDFLSTALLRLMNDAKNASSSSGNVGVGGSVDDAAREHMMDVSSSTIVTDIHLVIQITSAFKQN